MYIRTLNFIKIGWVRIFHNNLYQVIFFVQVSVKYYFSINYKIIIEIYLE